MTNTSLYSRQYYIATLKESIPEAKKRKRTIRHIVAEKKHPLKLSSKGERPFKNVCRHTLPRHTFVDPFNTLQKIKAVLCNVTLVYDSNGYITSKKSA